jgi:NAD(P)-dependent dehydrogenase (short-subunit alcohol dehydrogenase family)
MHKAGFYLRLQRHPLASRAQSGRIKSLITARVNYSASKYALLGALEWLAIEQAKGPLNIHVLIPGAVYTPLISGRLKDPADAWPELELIMPNTCVEIALKGLDLDLFYIPTQAHIFDDMQSRVEGVRTALHKLGIRSLS